MRTLFAGLAVLAAAPAWANIDTTMNDEGTSFPFGSPNTATYGQTFAPATGDGTLTGFSLYMRGRPAIRPGSGPLNLKGYVATWDGSKAGTVLYSSGIQMMNADATLQEFAFTTSIPIVAGNLYVAFLSLSDLPAQPRSVFGTPLAGNQIPGAFVFLNSGTDFASLFTSDWAAIGSDDIFFKASFDPVPVTPGVPEPATWGLMLLGFGAVGLMRRRRKVSGFFTTIVT